MLKQGLAVYEKLKGDIQWAVGLKNGAERLSTNIVQTFTEVNMYLDEREKTILQNLGLA